MKGVLKSIARRTPNSVTSSIRGTKIESAYNWLYLIGSSQHSATVSTRCGSFEYTAPSGTNGENVVRKINQKGLHEPHLTNELCAKLDSSSVFYDVGSHYGYFIHLAITAGVPMSQITGFEAAPNRVEALNRKFEGVQIVSGRVGQSAVGRNSIDEYADEHQPPTTVKIDVDGGEYEVLAGMEDLLNQHQPTVYVEVHPEPLENNERDVNSVLSLLTDAGYELSASSHRENEHKWADLDVFDITENTFLVKAT